MSSAGVVDLRCRRVIVGLGANLGESESQEGEHDSEERERHWGNAFDRDDCPGKAKLQILRAGRAT